jgi:hypothetical protein
MRMGSGARLHRQWFLASLCQRATVCDASLSQYLDELCRRCAACLIGPGPRVYRCAVDRVAAGMFAVRARPLLAKPWAARTTSRVTGLAMLGAAVRIGSER